MPAVRRWPDPAEPGLVVRVTPGPPAGPDAVVSQLAAAVPLRHTNRQPFAAKIVPASVLSELATAAETEGASLGMVDAVGRAAILGLVRDAERTLRSRGIYRAAHIEWSHLAHGRRDVLPRNAFGPWDALEALPLRDFGLPSPTPRRRPSRSARAPSGPVVRHRVPRRALAPRPAPASTDAAAPTCSRRCSDGRRLGLDLGHQVVPVDRPCRPMTPDPTVT